MCQYLMERVEVKTSHMVHTPYSEPREPYQNPESHIRGMGTNLTYFWIHWMYHLRILRNLEGEEDLAEAWSGALMGGDKIL